MARTATWPLLVSICCLYNIFTFDASFLGPGHFVGLRVFFSPVSPLCSQRPKGRLKWWEPTVQKSAEEKMQELTTEWRGTVRNLWSSSGFDIFVSPSGLYDLLSKSAANLSDRSTISGDSRRAAPKHLVLVCNGNQNKLDQIEVSKLFECLKDATGKLSDGTILLVMDGQGGEKIREYINKDG